jgi:hypothetical protein
MPDERITGHGYMSERGKDTYVFKCFADPVDLCFHHLFFSLPLLLLLLFSSNLLNGADMVSTHLFPLDLVLLTSPPFLFVFPGFYESHPFDFIFILKKPNFHLRILRSIIAQKKSLFDKHPKDFKGCCSIAASYSRVRSTPGLSLASTLTAAFQLSDSLAM